MIKTLQKGVSRALSAASYYVGGYDATEDRGRRRVISSRTMAEDSLLDTEKRRILSANAADLQRNFSAAAWAIRKHLDYVSSFSLQACTGDRAYNQYFEQAIQELAMKRGRFEVTRRHSFRKALRLTEACRLKDGDCFWLKLAPATGPARGLVQSIEGDRVRWPNAATNELNSYDKAEWTNGVKLNPKTGAAQSYMICDRYLKGSFALRRVVPERNVLSHGFYDRWDQVRGVSPIAAALNNFRDVYEGKEYAMAKLKAAQLLGFEFYREATDSPFDNVTATADADGDGTNDSAYEVDANGLMVFDMDMGERVGVIESKTPATETVNFLKLMIHLALKSLDIPYSFFDESFTNFYGSRGGLVQYLKSCVAKQADLIELQNDWLRWRAGLLIADGELDLPPGGFEALKWKFIPDGVPWWDTVKEVRGQAMAVAAGFTSPQQACREIGTRYEDNIDAIAEAQAYADEQGVTVRWADTTAFNPDVSTGDSEGFEENTNEEPTADA